MIKRLIFDVDGTLIVGVNFIPSIEATLKKLGIYSLENVKLFLEAICSYETRFNNYNKKDYTKYFGEALNVELDDRFLDVFFEELKKCVPLKNRKLKETLQALSEKYELVLLTNYFKESQLNRLNTMGLDGLFLECYGEELIKPNDEIYIKACGNHNPSECVMIGDDLCLDIEKSQSLGINTIWVNSKKIKVDSPSITVEAAQEISTDLIESIALDKNQIL